MRITSIGHAGLLMETGAGRILCDPWFNPAYFGSWFPFPDNSAFAGPDDPAGIRDAEYLFVSHQHLDHLDPVWLRDHMSKSATVLLPDFPVSGLRTDLEGLGFKHFVQTRHGEPVELDGGLRVLIDAQIAPNDGSIGDSSLAVDDGTARILNQNDGRPVDDDGLLAFGAGTGADSSRRPGFDAHFVQYSGAIWYPMVYDFPDRMKATVGRRKRENSMLRAIRYIERYQARHVFPFAGPPCFLDDDLFELNDFDDDPANIFPNQMAFLEFLKEHGHDQGRLFIPGTVIELGEQTEVHQVPQRQIEEIYGDTRTYLKAYQERKRPVIAAERASWPAHGTDGTDGTDATGKIDLLAELKAWMEPLLVDADYTCAGLNGRILLETQDPATSEVDEQIVFDFLTRTIGHWDGEAECRYRFRAARPLIEDLVRTRTEDWGNKLFLSCRFEASRKGPYNEYVYSFFKSLSAERMAYIEGFYADSAKVSGEARVGGHTIQRQCPHRKADLTRFGTVTDGVLTCQMHGWQFEVASGRCLNSDDQKLATRVFDPATDGDLPEVPATAG